MIHKQYMDLLNTSPTYIFFYLRDASLQGVKATVDTKTVHRFVLTHTNKQNKNKKKEMNNPPFAKVKNIIQTWGPFIGNAHIHTHRQVSGARHTWGHYLTKIFRGQFSPQFLILVKGWEVMLGEQAADNLKERRSLWWLTDKTQIRGMRKVFFSHITTQKWLWELWAISKSWRWETKDGGQEEKEQW